MQLTTLLNNVNYHEHKSVGSAVSKAYITAEQFSDKNEMLPRIPRRCRHIIQSVEGGHNLNPLCFLQMSVYIRLQQLCQSRLLHL